MLPKMEYGTRLQVLLTLMVILLNHIHDWSCSHALTCMFPCMGIVYITHHISRQQDPGQLTAEVRIIKVLQPCYDEVEGDCHR